MRKFKKCLITGISGSGGSYLCEHIIKKNKFIKIYGTFRSNGYKNLLQKKYKSKIKFFKCDLQIFSDINSIINKIKPDLVFHIASNANVGDSFNNPLIFSKNNNSITANLLESLRLNNSKAVIIICSSSEVYGNVEKNKMPIAENCSLKPINPYAVTKAYQDLLSQMYYETFNLKIIITRMFSDTNARRSNLFQTSFAKQIIECKRGQKKFLSHGNLSSVRTFIDIDDAMEAYWLAATKGRIGEIYNICGDKVISVKNYLSKLIKFSECSIKLKLDKSLLRKKDIFLQKGCCKKFKKHTGWKPKVDFNASIKKLLHEVGRIY